jgi:hypothetical protein
MKNCDGMLNLWMVRADGKKKLLMKDSWQMIYARMFIEISNRYQNGNLNDAGMMVTAAGDNKIKLNEYIFDEILYRAILGEKVYWSSHFSGKDYTGPVVFMGTIKEKTDSFYVILDDSVIVIGAVVSGATPGKGKSKIMESFKTMKGIGFNLGKNFTVSCQDAHLSLKDFK